jgi:hypothetical protein
MEKFHHAICLDVALNDVTAKTLAFLEQYASALLESSNIEFHHSRKDISSL